MARYKQPHLPAWLGDRLHKALKLYFYNLSSGLHQADPFAPLHAQLTTHFRHYRKRYGITKRNLNAGWTEKQVRWWVIGAVRRFLVFFEKEKVSWFREEWALDLIYLDDDGKHMTHLGEPDLVLYSQRRQRYMVLDFKTADDNDKYIHQGRDSDRKKWDKLLGYAYGARQKMRHSTGRKMDKITIGYVVFIRKKVRKERMPPMTVLEQSASRRRLENWHKRFLREIK